MPLSKVDFDISQLPKDKSNSLIVIHDVQAVAGAIAVTLKLMDYPDVYILK